MYSIGVALAAVAAWVLSRRSYTWLLLVFPFAAGLIYLHVFLAYRTVTTHLPFGEPSSLNATALRETSGSDRFKAFTARIESPYRGNVRMIVPPTSTFTYGEVLRLRGTIMPAARENELPTIAFPAIERTGDYRGSAIMRTLVGAKMAFIGVFKQTLPPRSAALLSGILTGYRSDFSDAFKIDMARSGTTHIVALSGYNISILVVIMASLLAYVMPKRHAFWWSLAAIGVFVAIVGAEASVVRAALMGAIALFAGRVGRRYSARHAIAFAATLMALSNPLVLRFDVGFQLSFLSLVGILYVMPAFAHFFRVSAASPSPFGWRESLLSTASAQCMVLPVLVGVFGNFSFSSFLANMLILGTVPFTMLAGFILGIVGMLSIKAGIMLGWAVHLLLAYQIGVMHFSASLPLMATGYGMRVVSISITAAALFYAYRHGRTA